MKNLLMTIVFTIPLVMIGSLSFSDSFTSGAYYYADSAIYYGGSGIPANVGRGLSYETRNSPTYQGNENGDYFFPLRGGAIIVEFSCPIINGAGDDLEIIETTNPCNWLVETADVYASSCGTEDDDFVYIGTAYSTFDSSMTSSTVGNLNKTNNSNVFDLGSLNCAKYIKIVDTTETTGTLTSDKGYDFDLNSVGSLQPKSDPCQQCNALTVPLFAGQTTEVGSIIVLENSGTICVTYTTSGDWFIKEIHLAIESSPAFFIVNKNDNPKVGQFEYSDSFDPMVQETTSDYCKTFTDPLTGPIYIAAHAEVVKVVDGIEQTESAWSDGEGFGGANWAMYTEYVSQCN